MNNNYLSKLEYDKILDILSSYCNTFMGKEKCLALRPSYDKSIIQDLLNETNEASSLLHKSGSAPIYEIANISTYLNILNSNGTLSAKALLEIANVLKISDELKIYFNQDYINKTDFPILRTYFENLYSNKSLYTHIYNCILDENTISDDASTTLKDIRRNEHKIEQNIKNSLNNILHSYTKYIQENIITLRNNRYVIPVKEEYKTQIKGLVHDTSSTGSTVFIEPLSVFELNNELNNLKIKEKIEIEKILQSLSMRSFPTYRRFKINV